MSKKKEEDYKEVLFPKEHIQEVKRQSRALEKGMPSKAEKDFVEALIETRNLHKACEISGLDIKDEPHKRKEVKEYMEVLAFEYNSATIDMDKANAWWLKKAFTFDPASILNENGTVKSDLRQMSYSDRQMIQEIKFDQKTGLPLNIKFVDKINAIKLFSTKKPPETEAMVSADEVVLAALREKDEEKK